MRGQETICEIGCDDSENGRRTFVMKYFDMIFAGIEKSLEPKFRLDPEVFRAPDGLPDHHLWITEVGCSYGLGDGISEFLGVHQVRKLSVRLDVMIAPYGLGDGISELLGVHQVRKLSVRLDGMIAKMEEDDDEQWLTREWNMVALALDHLFLYSSFGLLAMEIVYCVLHILHT